MGLAQDGTGLKPPHFARASCNILIRHRRKSLPPKSHVALDPCEPTPRTCAPGSWTPDQLYRQVAPEGDDDRGGSSIGAHDQKRDGAGPTIMLPPRSLI